MGKYTSVVVMMLLLVGSSNGSKVFKKVEDTRKLLKSAREAGKTIPQIKVISKEAVKTPGDTLHYDGPNDDNAVGLVNGGTFQGAIRLTPTELTGYSNWQLTEVIFYHYETTSHSGQVIIYGPGNDSTPGSTITTESYTAPAQGWISVPLSTPILIDPSQDLWISVEITHAQGEYPLGVDAGPATPYKGDFVSTDGTTWGELRDYGLDYNWNIRGIVEPAGDSTDPLPPSNLTAYSDFTTPTQILLSWTDPTHYVGGDTLTDFYIEIWRDSAFVDTVPKGVQSYTDNGLTDGTLYTYQIRTHDRNDSTSAFAETSWYAGGSPWPASPQLNAVNIINDSAIEVVVTTPTTQSDGTPLDDLAGIYIYVDSLQTLDHPTTDTGVTIYDTVTVTPGRRTVFVTAYDNETPVHESEASNSVTVTTNVHTGGPDGFGYVFYDSDHPSGPSFEWIDASTGTVLTLDDEDYTLIDLPFPFPYYQEILNQIYVSSNGFLSSTGVSDYSNDSLPDTTKHNIIAAFWDDLDPSSGGTVYYLSTPDYAVIEWYQVPGYYSGGPYTFEVVLYPNGNIVFNSLQMMDPIDESTTGIQGADGSNDYYLLYSYNGNPITVHDSLTILFIRPVFSHDVAVTSISSPPDLLLTGTTVTPQIDVHNFGTSTESFDVIMDIYEGGNLIYSDTQTVSSLPPDSTLPVSFTQYTFDSSAFDYQAIAYTLLVGDENTSSDTLSKDFVVAENIMDFEANDGGFTADPVSGAWEWGAPADTVGPGSAHSGTNVWGTVLGGNYENNADWSLYSIDLYATQDNPVIGFFHWYNMEKGYYAYDGGNVSISTDGGATWTIIYPEGGYPESDVSGLNNEPGFSGTSDGWQLAKFNLNVAQGTYFKLRFHFGSDGSINYDGWYIDDFITSGAIVGIGENDHAQSYINLLYGPASNPVSGIGVIKFSVAQKTKVSLELFDVTGRKVRTLYNALTEPGIHSVRFNSKGLPQGIYFLRMNAGNIFNSTKKILVVN